jgi:hypothetical protein
MEGKMRTGIFAALGVLATLTVGCGGDGSTHLQHPTLDQDYAGSFAGTWQGSLTLVIAGQTQTSTGSQPIDRTGFNRVSIAEMCPGLDGAAGLDSATTFSMDPMTCPPINQSCGPVTIRYESGIGNLAQERLTITLTGTASGCGQSLGLTATFTGTLGHALPPPTTCDASTGSGPTNPPPSDLWQPASGSTPAAGNYVYLQSDPGDYIGQGMTLTYTAADTAFSVSAVCNRVTMIVGNEIWHGDFQGMSGTAQLQPGYYGNLARYPFHNPAVGGLSWSGQGRGCNTLTGWFVVDSVTYNSGVLSAIDLRFEQHCEGGPAALHGQIHWTAGP